MVQVMMNTATAARMNGADRKKPPFPRLLLGSLSLMATVVGIRPLCALFYLDSKSKLSDAVASGWLLLLRIPPYPVATENYTRYFLTLLGAKLKTHSLLFGNLTTTL